MRHAVQTKFHRRKTSSCLAVNTTVMSGNILSASGEKTSDADRQMGCRWCERQELQPTRGATPSLCKTTSENTGTKHNQKKTKNRKKHNHHRNFYVDRLSTGVMCCFPLPVCFSLLFVSFAWSPGPCVSFVFPLCSPWHVVCLEFFSLDFCILFFALRVFRH